ncbi:hypothetical protein BDN67DRAFT_997756 [Paxillus ammoniavirescens]|nr:hypothetical protein BDN67DRAFT_997756 [Paxillus ammoniavirescens]
MSSPEDDHNDGGNQFSTIHGNKKRCLKRACDMCRRKKSQCDADVSRVPGNRCSNCLLHNVECTYVEVAEKRGVPKRYVESLENRLEKMEKLLKRVYRKPNSTQQLGGARIDGDMWKRGNASSLHVMNTPSTPPNAVLENDDDLVPSDDEDIVTVRLSESLKNMNLNPSYTRFFGKSSGIMLIQKAMDFKKEYTGGEDSRSDSLFNTGSQGERFPWENVSRYTKEPEYAFPDEDLGMSLVDLYFVYMNCLAPLLHRPSFERKVIRGDHLRDSSFGAVYLLVCAVGSQFSDDHRVFLEGTNSEQSVGWKYFQQVHVIMKTLLEPPCLEDLQVYCLSVLFLQGTSRPQACWTIVGIGIRLAQDVGAHRRKAYGSKPSVEGELWKRAFWVLFTFDRQMSSYLGRPRAIQEEDFDVDFPVECDDEYWEHPDPEQAFKQPPDKPCTMSFFTSFLKLNHILAVALRTIYSIHKSKVVGQQWEQRIAELDSALNQWIDAVPEHLRWDPTRDFPAFTAGSVLLLNICGGKRCGVSMDASKEMADVHKCMAILKHCEKRWHTSRRLLEILCDLAAAEDLPLLQLSPAGWTKRVRESESPPSTEGSGSTSPEGPRTIAGSRPIPQDVQSQSQSQSQQSQRVSPPLNPPFSSNELGRLALHGQVDFSTSSFAAPTTGSTVRQVDPLSMWYSSLSTGTHHSPHEPPPASGFPHMHDYAHPSVSFMYSTDKLYHGQMTSSFAGDFTSQHRAPDATQFSGPGAAGGGPGTGRHAAMHDSQAPIDASVSGQPLFVAAQTQPQIGGHGHGYGYGYGHGHTVMDPDAIAKWSTAPTGFGFNDWGTYITNVSDDKS